MTEKTAPQTPAPAAANDTLWSSVKETDPRYTKNFSRAGGFKGTAIGATYLAMRATETFGPMGIGWGVEIDQEELMTGAPILVNGEKVANELIHKVRVRLWFKHNGERGEITQFGQTTFVGRNSNGVFTDEEAPKKSLTDGMTKCLSLLGFSADVHMGLYDDNKYVAELRTKYDEIEAHKRGEPSEAEKERAKPVLAEVKSGKLTREQAVTALDKLNLSDIAYERALAKADELLAKRVPPAADSTASTPASETTDSAGQAEGALPAEPAAAAEVPEEVPAESVAESGGDPASATDPEPAPADPAPEASDPSEAEKALVKPLLARVKSGQLKAAAAIKELAKLDISASARQRATNKIKALTEETRH